MIRVLGLYTVERIYLNGGTSGSQTFADLMTAVNAEGAQVSTIGRGGAIDLGGMTINVLHPAGLTGDTNEDSLVLLFGCGTVEVLITGDATTASEASMLGAGLIPEVDVLKVGHHGSNTSSSQAFIDVTSPQYAVISAGLDNQFGHPHQEVVDRFAAANAQLIYTDTTDDDDSVRMTSRCLLLDGWADRTGHRHLHRLPRLRGRQRKRRRRTGPGAGNVRDQLRQLTAHRAGFADHLSPHDLRIPYDARVG